MPGPVESTLVDGIREKGCIHLALIDPEKFSNNLPEIVNDLEEHGTSAIMVGGSTLKSPTLLDRTVKTIRDSCSLPTILFPNGPVGISRDRKSTRLNSSHSQISYAVFCLKKKTTP